MLFVDDHHPEGAKTHVVGEQRVRADDDVDRAVRQPFEHRLAFLGAKTPGEQLDRERPLAAEHRRVGDRQTLEVLTQRGEVLLSEHLGGGHQCALAPTVDGREQCGERDHGLARTDIALEQTVHGQR